MTTRFVWWLNLVVNVASIALACIVSLFFLRSEYNGGGGAVYVVVIVTALLFRMLIESVLKRALKK